jgi:hypothetical protein
MYFFVVIVSNALLATPSFKSPACVRFLDVSFVLVFFALQKRHNTENSKQIFPGKEFCGLSPNFHIHVSVKDLYIPTIGLHILLQENMWTDPGFT